MLTKRNTTKAVADASRCANMYSRHLQQVAIVSLMGKKSISPGIVHSSTNREPEFLPSAAKPASMLLENELFWYVHHP